MKDYAIARVRGMRGRLLGRHGVLDLLAEADLASRVELLRRAGLATAGARSVRDVARDLRAGVIRDAAAVDRLVAGTRTGRLLRAMAAIADVWVLMTILRGVERNEAAARLRTLVEPTLELDEAALRELVGRRTVADVVALLASWSSPYAAPLEDALRTSGRRADLVALEVALGRFVYARALAVATREGADGRIVVGLVRTLVDLANVATLVKLTVRGSAGELFVPGGHHLARARFERLAKLPADELDGALAADRELRLEPALVDGRIDPFRFDRLVLGRLRDEARRVARQRPLSVAVPLLYFLDRLDDLLAVRLVLEGTALALPAGELADLLELAR